MLVGKRFKYINQLVLFTLSILFIGIISAIVFSPFIPKSVELAIGDVAEETIFSPNHIEFESQIDLDINKQKFESIKQKTSKMYQIDKRVNKTIRQNIRLLFDQVRSNDSSLFSEEFLIDLNEDVLSTILNVSSEETDLIEKITFELADSILAEGLKEKNDQYIHFFVKNNINEDIVDVNYIYFISHTLAFYLKGNLIYDPIKTQIVYDKMLESVPLSKSIFKKGQPIIYAQEKVTSFHIEAFKALGIYQQKMNLFKLSFVILITIFCFILVERCVFLFYPMYYSIKYCILMSTITIIVLLFGRVSLFINILPKDALPYLLVPIGIASILITFLMTANLAFIVGTITSLLASIMFKLDFNVFLFLLFCSYTTTISVYNASKRSDLIIAGYIIGILNCFFVLSLGLFKETSYIMFYAYNFIFGFLSGVLASMISLAILPYFEALFKITTTQTLLELSNLNHPLMKKLLFNAPGTYQHSLMVANLAEAAADKVNANGVLCRVGSYFHDVGKLKQPEYFIENQFSKNNPHESLTPKMSKSIITSHTEEGLLLAQKHRLPKLIQDIIMEHHGTSLLSVFYFKEFSDKEYNTENENLFRYQGPKPSSKESGIIMLADSVEAATKALEKPSAEQIETTIEKVFKEKLDDLQLVHCPLSFFEITQIKETFLEIYKGVHHNRNNYEHDIESIINKKKES